MIRGSKEYHEITGNPVGDKGYKVLCPECKGNSAIDCNLCKGKVWVWEADIPKILSIELTKEKIKSAPCNLIRDVSKCDNCELMSECIKTLRCELKEECPDCKTDNIWIHQTNNSKRCDRCFHEW